MAVAFSALATGVSWVFAVVLLGRWLRRGTRALLYWGVSLAMFAVASSMLLLGVTLGWSSATFRTFYLFGAVLNVPWLAMGSVVVNAGERSVTRATGVLTLLVAALLGWALAGGGSPGLLVPGVLLGGLWGLIQLSGDPAGVRAGSVAVLGVFTAVAVLAVLSSGFTTTLPRTGLPEGSRLFPEAVRGLAVAGNAVGVTIVVLGALSTVLHLLWQSTDRRAHRELRRTGLRAPVEAVAAFLLRGTRAVREGPRGHLAAGNLVIALGVLLAAAGGAFSFLGETTGHAVGLGLGVTVMYLGFRRTVSPRSGAAGAPRSSDPTVPTDRAGRRAPWR